MRSSRYKWHILAIGVGAQAAFGAVFQGIPVAGLRLQGDYHFSTFQLGVVLAAVTFGIAVSDVFWGMLADRIGERTVLIAGLCGTTGSLAVITVFLVPDHGTAPPYWALAAVLLGTGAMGGCINSASGRAVMGWFPASKRGLAISLRVAAVPLGGAVGAAVLPPLAVTVGFRWAFAFLAAGCLLATVAVALWLDEPPLGRTRKTGGPGAAAGLSPLRRWDIWRVAITALLLDVPQYTILTFGAIFLHRAEHLSFFATTLLLVVTLMLGAGSRVAGGWWTDRRGGRHRRTLVTVYGWLIAGGFAAMAALQHGPRWVIAGLLVLSGALAFGWHGVHYAEIATMAGPERSGTALGLENTLVFSGACAAPLLVASLASWTAVMLLAGVLPAAAAALLMPRQQPE